MTLTDPGSAHPRPRQWVLRVQTGVLLDAPLTPTHGSAPWAAVVWPDDRAPDGWARSALWPGPHGRGYVVAHDKPGPGGRRQTAALLTPGDVVEFAVDYSRPAGRGGRRVETVAVRWHGVVLDTDPHHVVVWGPMGAPSAAWDVAQAALKNWREARAVTVTGITDVPASEPAPAPDPAVQLAASSVADPNGAAAVTVVNSPDHGTLRVDAAAFGAAMGATPEALIALLGDGAPGVKLTGREDKVTLAALAADLAADRLTGATTDGPDRGAPGPAAYHGEPDGSVTRRQGDTQTSVRPLREWSPDGFGWGHGGETAHELAYALLADATGSPQAARRLAGRHAADVVSRLPSGRAWSLPVAEVRNWAAEAAVKTGLAITWPVPVAAGAATPDEGAGL